jgi:2-oxoglutarate dehydrogenase E1 component
MNQLKALREKYKKAEWVWVQEEPANSGALTFLKMNLFDDFPCKYVSRPASAASATGFSKIHAKEQQKIVDDAFAI